METVFRINPSSLDHKFIATLRSLFKKRDIEITVMDVPNDETEYLLSNPKNKAHLLKAIEEVRQNKNLIRFTAAEFEKYNKKLLRK